MLRYLLPPASERQDSVKSSLADLKDSIEFLYRVRDSFPGVPVLEQSLRFAEVICEIDDLEKRFYDVTGQRYISRREKSRF